MSDTNYHICYFQEKAKSLPKREKTNKALQLCPCNKPETMSPGLTLIGPKKKKKKAALKLQCHVLFWKGDKDAVCSLQVTETERLSHVS